MATLPFGVVSDRSNRVRLLQIVVVLWGGATVLSAASVSYVMLLVSRLALGGVVAAAGPAVASLVGDLFPADERGRLYGFVLTGELVGAGFGILAAGSLSGLLGWRLSLVVLAVPAFVLAWAVRRWFPEPARGGQAQLQVGDTEIATVADVDSVPQDQPAEAAEAPHERSAVEEQAEDQGVEPVAELVLGGDAHFSSWEAFLFVLRVRTNVALIVASGLGYFFFQGVETFAELFFRDRFGVGQSLASILFVLVAAGAVFGVLLSGRSADRLIGRGRTNARMVVAGVAYVATAVAFVPGVLVPVLAVSLPVLVVAAACLGAVNPAVDAARLDVMPSTLWGRAESVRTALRQLLQGLAPLVFGVVSSAFGGANAGFGAGVDAAARPASGGAGHGLELAFVVLSVPLVAAGAVLFLSRNRYLRDVVAAGRSEAHLSQ